MPEESSIPQPATIKCATARELQATEYSYGRSATKESPKEERVKMPLTNSPLFCLIYYVYFFISTLFNLRIMSSKHTQPLFPFFL